MYEVKDKPLREERRTRRGRTSTISSGTKKIKAFIFLAIEIANFAVESQSIEPKKLKFDTHHSAASLRSRRSYRH